MKKTTEKVQFVVVLNDGETYSGLDGCRIVEIPDFVDEEDHDQWVEDHFAEGTLIEPPAT